MTQPWSKEIARAEFDLKDAEHFKRQGMLVPWRIATWRERLLAVVLWTFMGGIVFPVMAIAMLTFLGMTFEHFSKESERIDRCKRQAVTPYEYHRC